MAISWRVQACLIPAAIQKRAKVGFVQGACTAQQHGWAVADDGLVSYSEWVLRPSNPPKTPASCKANTSVMIGSSPAGIKLSVAGGGRLVSSACKKEALCVLGGGLVPVLGPCSSPLAVGWNASKVAAAVTSVKTDDEDMARTSMTAAFLLGLLLVSVQPAAAKPLPHLISILQDDLGYYDSGVQSDSAASYSRNISALAQQGIVLTNFYVHWHCSPTRRSYLTGRLPIHHGEQLSTDTSDDIDLRMTWISAKLESAGYVGTWIGKVRNDEFHRTSISF
eukprot:SAG25_NODE_1861_length_2244_cov_1.411189_3_plen_279_part_00